MVEERHAARRAGGSPDRADDAVAAGAPVEASFLGQVLHFFGEKVGVNDKRN